VDRQVAAIEELVKRFPLMDPKVGSGRMHASVDTHDAVDSDRVHDQMKGSETRWCSPLQDESMQDIMVELRGKYKAVCAKMGIADKLSMTQSHQAPNASLDF
jgi:hypothetical protein